MSNLLKSKLFVGVMIVTVMVVGFAAFNNTAAADDCTITTTLRVGSTGAEVTCLQTLVGATADGKFGPMTKAAVMTWQTAHGLVADGVFGPLSRAAMGGTTAGLPAGCTSTSGYSTTTGVKCDSGTTTLPAGCTSTSGYSSTTGEKCDSSSSGPLTGGAGSVDTYALIAGLNDEEVGEDQEDVPVAGLEIETDDGSDLEFTAVRLDFADAAESADASVTADQDFEDYASAVSIWLDGEKVAEVDAEDFTDDNNWDKTVSLEGAICDAGDTCELEVAISGVSNLDSNDDSEPWGLDFAQVRFMDADGTVISEDPGVGETTFSFELFATAADTEFKITQGADEDEVNEGHVINIHATDETQNVPILSFNVEIEGDSDVTLDALPVTITVATQDNVDEMVSELSLYMDGEEVGSASMGSDCLDDADCSAVGTAEAYLFDDMDLTLEAGEEYEFLVKAGIYGITDTGDVAVGDTIRAAFGETETDNANFDAEDEAGENLADGDLTGTVTGEASEVRDVGFNLSLVSTDADVAVGEQLVQSDVGTFEIVFDVTPFDGDIFVDETAPDLSGGATESDLGEGGTAAGTVTCTIQGVSGFSNETNSYQVQEGDTGRFKITCDVRDGATDLVDGYADISLDSLLYALTDVDGDIVYNFNLTDFKTSQVFLDDREA